MKIASRDTVHSWSAVAPSLVFVALILGACTPAASTATCVPGRTESCACLGGATGVQVCTDDSRFAPCQCPGDDAAVGVDAFISDGSIVEMDGSSEDASHSDDAAVADAGSDAGGADAGRIHGHAVIIGNNVIRGDESWDRLFANAIFLTERTGDIRVLEYTQYSAGSGWEMHPRDVMDAEATARGRVLTRTELTSAPDLTTALASADVFFVPGQVYADEAIMNGIASFWHAPLVSFVDAGGVVVVVGADSGGHGGFEFHILDDPGLFGFGGGRMFVSMTSVISIVDTTDPLAAGVLTPFPEGLDFGECFPGSSRGTLVARSDALCPMVRHLVR
jgi:hypothetical protein